MNTSEELLLDEDGIPILTSMVQDDERAAALTPAEIAEKLLASDSFRQQLDEVAAELTRSVRQQMEQTMRPIIEEAINLSLDDSSTASYEAVRRQLESALPGFIDRAMQETSPDSE